MRGGVTRSGNREVCWPAATPSQMRRSSTGCPVCGTVHPARMLQNNTCRSGGCTAADQAPGSGIVSAAGRLGAASGEALDLAAESMRTLNRRAAEILRKYQVHACTDVTGFGLLGHLSEMVEEHHTVLLEEKCPALHTPGVRNMWKNFI